MYVGGYYYLKRYYLNNKLGLIFSLNEVFGPLLSSCTVGSWFLWQEVFGNLNNTVARDACLVF